jgi:hypothetical protein
MKHFSPSELVDFAEGTLAPARAAHADGCDDCRAQSALVRDAIRATAAAQVPEPSPLFWDHFSARVREGIAAEPPPTAWSWLGGRESLRAAAAIAIVVAVVAAASWFARDSRMPNIAIPVAQDQPAAVTVAGQHADVDASVDAANAEVWAVLTAAASDMAIDEAGAAGMKPNPAAVDRAVQELTSAELTELGRLLQSELKRSSN